MSHFPIKTLFIKSQKKLSLKAEGISMFPLVLPNDILFIKKVPFNKIRIHDLIVINKKEIIAHKVVYKQEKYLITKGINNPLSDGRIEPRQILGKVYRIRRGKDFIDIEDFYLIQSTAYFQEIIKIKKEFDKQQIKYVILKGLPLHLLYGGQHPRRIYADCDILIDKSEYKKSEKVFEKYSYQKKEYYYSKLHKLLKNKPTEISYVRRVNEFPVIFDLHFEAGFLMNQLGSLNALYSQELIDNMTALFLEEKQEILIQNESFSILSPSNLIIYLSLHFFHHNFRGIHMLNFLNLVVNKYKENKSILRKISYKINLFKLRNFIFPVFPLLAKYFQTTISREFLKDIEPDDHKLQFIRNNIVKVNLFNDETRVQAGEERMKNLFLLSPYPLIKKILILANPAVVYSTVWVIIFLARRSLMRAFRSF